MTSNFRTHLSHPKQTWTIHWESTSEQCLGLAAFVVARRRDEISPRGGKGSRGCWAERAWAGREDEQTDLASVVAKNDSSLNTLQMEVLKASIHALQPCIQHRLMLAVPPRIPLTACTWTWHGRIERVLGLNPGDLHLL